VPEHYVYVLLSLTDGMLYVGYTSNLERRISEHHRDNSKSTSSRRPLRLIFYECYLSKADAMRREEYFKTSAGKRVLRLMLKESLSAALNCAESEG